MEAFSEDRDYAARLASQLGDFVEQLRSKTVVPLFWVARVIVYGMLALALAVAAGIMAVDFIVKLLDAYLFGNRVWITYLIVGIVMLAVGAVSFKRMGKYNLERS